MDFSLHLTFHASPSMQCRSEKSILIKATNDNIKYRILKFLPEENARIVVKILKPHVLSLTQWWEIYLYCFYLVVVTV